MSLKIKISKQNLTSESRPTKRRIQRIESDDEDDAGDAPESSHGPPAAVPRRKKPRRASRGASGNSGDEYAEGDVEVDIDGDIEDTRFLPEPQPTISRSLSPAAGSKRRLSNAQASSSKARAKESKSAKSKAPGKKPRRQVVWTDDEDEEFDDPEVVVTDDDDFDPEPDYSSKKAGKGKSGKAGAGKAGTKGKSAKEKEEKEIAFRDERKLPPSVPASSQRLQVQDQGLRSNSALPVELPDEASLPKKRKLPPIKKNKPSTAGSTAPSTPSAAKAAVAATEKKETLTPAPTSNQVGTRKPAGASTDLNLLDSSVYSELFKSTPGASTPNSGLNRKQKEEERRRELNRMRDEARAKRQAEAKNSFDLQAAPEKIERFVLHRLRHSTARFPNVLGATFKEMYDRRRAPVPSSEQK
ncbi:hypothetical protein BV20DRAFT_1050317 [Pilatotrama ljubarskyi]|nr:hypothetical protein BV20DRAFT_1050317 [Pilatotrama ljubarskyi]